MTSLSAELEDSSSQPQQPRQPRQPRQQQQLEDDEYGPFEGGEDSTVVDSFAVPPLGCVCTLACDLVTKRAVVVDPGGDVRRIVKRLDSLRCSATHILITHAHFDHILAADVLRRETGAAVIMHPDDLPLWNRCQLQCREFGIAPPKDRLPVVDAFATHYDLLQCPGHLTCRCLHTPGHTAGSVTWLIQGRGWSRACVGDTLFKGAVGRTKWDDCYSSLDNRANANQLLSSIRSTLFALPEDTRVICGHGEPTTVGHEKSTNPHVIRLPPGC